MALPILENWESTRTALHQVALVLSAIRVASSDALPNDLQFSANVVDGGISTTELNIGGELFFDFASFTLIYVRDGEEIFKISAGGYNQQSLMQAVLDEFKKLDIVIEPSMKHITQDTPFAIDMRLAEDYATVVDAVYTMLARFKAKLSGAMSPLVIWPHHFDMAFIWFATSGTNEHKDPHLAIGFAPFSNGIDRPYFYGYGWSEATGYVQVDVKSPAKAITEGYTGLYAEYDALNTDDMAQILIGILLDYKEKASQALL